MNDAFTLISQFHFLRPLWLLILLLLPVLYFVAQRSTKNSSSWAQAINPQLLKYLLDDHNERAKKWPLVIFISACVLCLLALAGPAWKKMPQPVHQPDDGLVIVLDLSLTMQATDLKPSRLVATRHKLTDILRLRQQGQTALVVYAGDAHIVSPLTDDTKTIIAMVPALSPLIMPALGSRVSTGIELAKQALKDGGINKGRLLLITDGIKNKDIESIRAQIKDTRHQLSILVVGTSDGGPIPIPEQGFLRDKGEIVIAQTDMTQLQKLAQITAAPIAQLSLDDSDINTLLPNKSFDLNKSTHQVEREMDQWREEGPWLILLILPFAALAFRRGWLLSLMFVVMIQPERVEAADWSDQLWQTADQQGAKAFSDKDYQAASSLFESPEWQGSAAYKAGDFEAAVKHFSQSDDADAHYNRGNALAKMGQLDESLKAYDEALKRNPNLADAKANKKLIEEMAQQQQSDSQSSDDKSDQNSDRNQQQQSQDQQSSESQQGEDQQSQSQNQDQDQNPDGKQSDAEQQKDSDQTEAEQEIKQAAKEEAESKQAENEEKPTDNNNQQSISEAQQLSEEEQQAMEQWLRRIPDDPGMLLKRKFNYQYQQNKQNNQYVPQQENEAIW